jgi:hypothetical protein
VLLLIYEPARPDGEDRAGWMRRWDERQPAYELSHGTDYRALRLVRWWGGATAPSSRATLPSYE